MTLIPRTSFTPQPHPHVGHLLDAIKSAPVGALFICIDDSPGPYARIASENKRTDIKFVSRLALKIPEITRGLKFSAVVLGPRLVPTEAEQKVLDALKARVTP
jgi:hypothetical protein